MKDVWILSIKTSLPEVCEEYGDLKYEVRAFVDFEAARDALCRVLKKLAFQKNAMFDGQGGLIYLDRYMEGMEDWEEDTVEDLNRSRMKAIRDALEAVFRGEEVALPLEDGYYTDYMIAAEVKGNSIAFGGDYDGPINGYNPKLATNMFSMAEQKDWYYLYIDDRFGQDDYTAELYIDLKKAKLQE